MEKKPHSATATMGLLHGSIFYEQVVTGLPQYEPGGIHPFMFLYCISSHSPLQLRTVALASAGIFPIMALCAVGLARRLMFALALMPVKGANTQPSPLKYISPLTLLTSRTCNHLPVEPVTSICESLSLMVASTLCSEPGPLRILLPLGSGSIGKTLSLHAVTSESACATLAYSAVIMSR